MGLISFALSTLRFLALIFIVIATIIALAGSLFESEPFPWPPPSGSGGGGGSLEERQRLGMFEGRFVRREVASMNGGVNATFEIADVDTAWLPCEGIRHRLGGAAGLAITTVVFQGVMLFCALAEACCGPSSPLGAVLMGLGGGGGGVWAARQKQRRTEAVFYFSHALSLVTGLIAWALCASVYHGGFCSDNNNGSNGGNATASDWAYGGINFGAVFGGSGSGGLAVPTQPMGIAYGFALLVAGWVIQLVLVTALTVGAARCGGDDDDDDDGGAKAKDDFEDVPLKAS